MAQQKQLKEQQKITDIHQKFEELNKGTHTHELKALPPSPKEELNKKMDDFFKKKE